MKSTEEKSILSQIDDIKDLFQELDRKKSYDDFSGDSILNNEVTRFNTACVSLIERSAGANSSYHRQAAAITRDASGVSWNGNIPILYGIVISVEHDIKNGYLTSSRQLVHAELFSDFIEMADHLLSEGYKDAAAVLLGGVLETHLRKLADLESIPTTNSDGKAKKAETLNQELGKSKYGMLEQKTITAWLDLRNKAAHANYSQYEKSHVDLFSQGLKNFISANPA